MLESVSEEDWELLLGTGAVAVPAVVGAVAAAAVVIAVLGL